MRHLLRVAALVATVATVMVVPATALAAPGDGANVAKLECGFASPTTGLYYDNGDGRIINSPSGKSQASCTGLVLMAGQTPVTETTRTSYTWGTLDCEAVETTKGEARFSCH